MLAHPNDDTVGETVFLSQNLLNGLGHWQSVQTGMT